MNRYPRKALFLDRDGVININHGYVHTPDQCDFVSGIFDLCRSAHRKGYLIVIVTNQSGIARNYYSRKAFYQFSRWIEHQFWLQSIKITHTYHCPHHPQETSAYGRTCTCRKPKPGMIMKARRQFGIALRQSILVGDSLSDMQCAQRAGVGKAVLFRYAPHTNYAPALAQPTKKPYYQAHSFKQIATLL